MLKVLGMLQGAEKHFVGWGGHCDGPFTNSPGVHGSAVVTRDCTGLIQQPKGSSLAFVSLKAHSCNPAELLLPARRPPPLAPLLLFQGPCCALPRAPDLMPHHTVLTLLCPLPSHTPLGNDPSSRNSHSFSSPVILFGCIFFPELLPHVFPHSHLSCKL